MKNKYSPKPLEWISVENSTWCVETVVGNFSIEYWSDDDEYELNAPDGEAIYKRLEDAQLAAQAIYNDIWTQGGVFCE